MDKVILVGNSEYEKFAEILGNSRVTYIPHGIDCSFYCPSENGRKERLVLTVGNWLRDFHFADKVYQRLLSIDPELKICIVSSPNNQKYITESSRIRFLSGISDEKLLELYRQCSVLFLPLVRYTANNSLLEAGASGCNIVIASDYNDNSYIPNDLLTKSHMDVDETVDAIFPLISKLDSNIALSSFVNENYAWEIVAAYTNKEIRL